MYSITQDLNCCSAFHHLYLARISLNLERKFALAREPRSVSAEAISWTGSGRGSRSRVIGMVSSPRVTLGSLPAAKTSPVRSSDWPESGSAAQIPLTQERPSSHVPINLYSWKENPQRQPSPTTWGACGTTETGVEAGTATGVSSPVSRITAPPRAPRDWSLGALRREPLVPSRTRVPSLPLLAIPTISWRVSP